MEWNELIGFFIVLFVLLFPLLRRVVMGKKPSQPPEAEQQPEAPSELKKREVSSKPQPPSSYHTTDRLVRKDYAFQSKLEDYRRKSRIESRKLEEFTHTEFKEHVVSQAFEVFEPKKAGKQRTLKKILEKRPFLQKMVIVSEVLGRPKSFQED